MTDKIVLHEVIIPPGTCASNIGGNGLLILCILIACSFWVIRAVKVFFNYFQLLEIRKFYHDGLHIKEADLDNLSWHNVQQKLMAVQEEQQMCIHKQKLTELDVYNRILRFKNYMIAMVNKGLLPPMFRAPIVGDVVFLTQGLKYNLELVFFWGPKAIFANSYHLKDDFKLRSRRDTLAQELSSHFFFLGVINLVLSPAIFLWQILYSFFNYAEVIKRQPGSFGARRWSMYAQLYMRHFNELPHEFQARLGRGYKPACKYMECFSSPLLSVIAKNVAFFVGALLAVLLALTVWDEDVLKVEHVLTVITLFTVIITVCQGFIPDEHSVACPEQLLRRVVAQLHYAPDSWRGHAHTLNVRDQFAQHFQYTFAFILEELLSPIVTPFLLMFYMPKKSIEIVDFFRNFTIDIVGVGDVCSFAQLDVKKHGDPKWQDGDPKDADINMLQADDGKTELSLMHFAITNPKWCPPQEQTKFLQDLKEQSAVNSQQNYNDNPLLTSLNSLGSVDGLPTSLLFSTAAESRYQPDRQTQSHISHQQPNVYYSGAKSSEGPTDAANNGIMSNIMTSTRGGDTNDAAMARVQRTQEMTSLEMSVSALFMHELHHQRMHAKQAQQMWQTIAEDDDDLPHTTNNATRQQEEAHHQNSNFNNIAPSSSSAPPNRHQTSTAAAVNGGITSQDIFGTTLPPVSNPLSYVPSGDDDVPPATHYVEADVDSDNDDAAPREFHLTDYQTPSSVHHSSSHHSSGSSRDQLL